MNGIRHAVIPPCSGKATCVDNFFWIQNAKLVETKLGGQVPNALQQDFQRCSGRTLRQGNKAW